MVFIRDNRLKVVYHSNLVNKFTDYGILVPIVDDRSQKCFSELKKTFSHLEEVSLSFLPQLSKSDFLRVHNGDFMERFFDETLVEGELLKSYELIDDQGRYFRYDPSRGHRPLVEMKDSIVKQVRGTYFTMLEALRENFCFFLGGGMHHAMSFGGRGFCPVHDLVIGLRKLQDQKLIETAWVIDTDAHKGDGTAELTQMDESIQTLSIHMAKGWPLDGPQTNAQGRPHPWFTPSTIDIPIAAGEEGFYLEALKGGLEQLERDEKLPGLAVVVAGADPYEKDQLPSAGQLKLKKEQLLARDLLVYKFFESRGIPQCWVMAGGYGPYSYEIYTQFLKKVLFFMESSL